MSYCRSNGVDSDVYVIGTGRDLTCFGAGWRTEQQLPFHDRRLTSDWTYDEGAQEMIKLDTRHEEIASFHTTSRQTMIDHLLGHRLVGHLVADYALDRLRREITEHGDAYHQSHLKPQGVRIVGEDD